MRSTRLSVDDHLSDHEDWFGVWLSSFLNTFGKSASFLNSEKYRSYSVMQYFSRILICDDAVVKITTLL